MLNVRNCETRARVLWCPNFIYQVNAMLIFINRHQAELNGLSGGSSVAMVGGIGVSLVGTFFLVAGCLHWRFCARRPATQAVRR
jgi:hypothetical protein